MARDDYRCPFCDKTMAAEDQDDLGKHRRGCTRRRGFTPAQKSKATLRPQMKTTKLITDLCRLLSEQGVEPDRGLSVQLVTAGRIAAIVGTVVQIMAMGSGWAHGASVSLSDINNPDADPNDDPLVEFARECARKATGL